MSKAKTLRDMSQDELEAKEKQLQEEIFNLRFQHGTGQLENPGRMRETRKQIARVKTVLAQMRQG